MFTPPFSNNVKLGDANLGSVTLNGVELDSDNCPGQVSHPRAIAQTPKPLPQDLPLSLSFLHIHSLMLSDLAPPPQFPLGEVATSSSLSRAVSDSLGF